MTKQAGCADCGQYPVLPDQLCARHSPQYAGKEPFDMEPANDRDAPLVGDEECPTCGRTDCAVHLSDVAGIIPCGEPK